MLVYQKNVSFYQEKLNRLQTEKEMEPEKL
jgi:hypothetical protein